MPAPDAYLEGIENKRMMDLLRGLANDSKGNAKLVEEFFSDDLAKQINAENQQSFHKIREGIDKEIVDRLLERHKPSRVELQNAWFESLPSETRYAINDLMRVYGAPSMAELFECWSPEKARQKVNAMFNLDMQRLWKEYNENA